MMKIAFALVAFAAIAAAVPSEFTEEAPVLDSSLLETEVHTDIAKMKKKGATEADCKDLAKTSCNEVLREVNTNQGLINKLKTGSQCIGRGQGGVTKMTLRWKKETKIHHSWTLKVKEVLRRKVTITSQRFSSLKRGHCGFIFSSRGYLSIHRSYKHAVSMELKYRGRSPRHGRASFVPGKLPLAWSTNATAAPRVPRLASGVPSAVAHSSSSRTRPTPSAR